MIITITHEYKEGDLAIAKYNVYNPITKTNTLVDTEEEVNNTIKLIVSDLMNKIIVNTLHVDRTLSYWESNTVITTTITVS